jgi:hypothetical protein
VERHEIGELRIWVRADEDLERWGIMLRREARETQAE